MLYVLHGEDDAAALAWLSEKKQAWIPPEWAPFNFHQFDSKKESLEELQNLIVSVPMGSEYRVIVVENLAPRRRDQDLQRDRSDASRKKQIAHILKNLPSFTMVILWFVPGPKDPKKIPLGVDWKETLKGAQYVKCMPRAPEEDASVFSFLDSLGERKTSRALWSLKNLILQGEPPLRLLAALTNQVRLLWQIKTLEDEGENGPEIAKRLAIHPFRVTKGLKHARNFRDAELPRFFDWLSRADRSLKTGKQEPGHLLELLVLRLCKG